MHAMGNEGAWQALHDELNTQATQFTELEQWFAVEATERGGVAITRLRIHDVLLWGALEDGGQERRRLLDAGNDALGQPRRVSAAVDELSYPSRRPTATPMSSRRSRTS